MLLHAAETPAQQQQTVPPASVFPVSPVEQSEEVVIRAREQQKTGDVYTLRGDVEILYQNYILRAEEIIYDAASGEITATGKVQLDGGDHDEHVEAESGRFNIKTETGQFKNVVATTGARMPTATLASGTPFIFIGEMVEKTGPDTYVIHNGSVTSCELPKPKWSFKAGRIEVDLDEKAKIYNSTFRIREVPVMYFPYASHATTGFQRQSGFLVPVIGASSRKGTTLGASYYWAINRSMDLTVGAEYYSERGWGQLTEFRAKPTRDSHFNLNFYGVSDRGLETNNQDQGGQEVKASGEAQLPYGFRGVADINYLSSFIFRLAFTDAFSRAVNSEVKSIIFASKNLDGFSFNSRASRYQNYQSSAIGDSVRIFHTPSLEVSTVDRHIENTPLVYNFTAAMEGISRREPGFQTSDLVGRFHLQPSVALPLYKNGWSLRPELMMRETYYTQRRATSSGVGAPITEGVNRWAVDMSVEMRPPSLGRIFEKQIAGRQIKHVVEPRVKYRYVDGVDNFRSIIRFDARDILSNTNEVEYGITQRIYTRRMQQADCIEIDDVEAEDESENLQQNGQPDIGQCEDSDRAGYVREFLRWDLAQKAFIDRDFGGAVINGRRNVFTTSADFTGIAFLTEPRHASPIISRLRVRSSANTEVEWNFDYDPKEGRINGSTALVNVHLGDYLIGASHALLNAPGEIFTSPSDPVGGLDRFNQYRLILGYGDLQKRGWSGAVNVGVDSTLSFLQYAAFQSTYNWDCCGVSVEYRRFSLGSVRNENQFRFGFNLANVGSFGNLRRRERLYD